MSKPWFRKRKGLFTKDMGYGWTPISWEGWIVIVIFLASVFSAIFYFDLPSETNARPYHFILSD